MQSKYVNKYRDMPSSVLKGSCVDSLAGLRENWLNLEPGISGGFGGMRNEYLRCAAQNCEDDEASNMEDFGLKHLNGEFPPWFYKVWNSVSTV